MYLWKCWRDTRLKLAVFAALFALLALANRLAPAGREHAFTAMELQNAFLASLWLTSLPLLFVGWILGETNPGADIHRGSGDFLLVRPVSRGSLIWTGWAVGMLEGIVLWAVISVAFLAVAFFELHRWGDSTSFILSAWITFSKIHLPILPVVYIINLGLVYGLTYAIGVFTRSGSWAMIGSAGLIFGYQLLRDLLGHKLQVWLPTFLLSYPGPHHDWAIPALHAYLVRGALALAFPVLAHFALERMEIHS